MWFEKLVGFKEDRDQVYEQLEIQGAYLYSKANGRRFRYGKLELPTLATLRKTPLLEDVSGELVVKEVVSGVQELHQAYPKAVFQVASQFNLLEMVGPHVSPEAGVGIYEYDRTQGPACAITCGAGTIYRNYFVPLGDQIGQHSDRQINCLDAFEAVFEEERRPLWNYQNGYILPSPEQLQYLNEHILALDQEGYEALRGKLKSGIQWNTEVTLSQEGHTVTQVYASALPIAYTEIPPKDWEPFARLILEAAYEAVFWVALKQYKMNGNKNLFLTLVGAGAFQNPLDWVLDALDQAIQQFQSVPLEVSIVSYGNTNPALKSLTNFQPDKPNK